ncbi:undecaprenyl-diphosphatase [Sphingomonas gellani]|uniref:Undecaprenyl-diphosphatase n=1 Tax=Sphingomonas gellani TaxID=1166340 RepID=A0A1H8B824_9SPHN|nr:phosphatase PAP2 family protein [Sphingomonas gellani]SEM78188.1 undecaprenyl-diphosphatase [Sphingomonas gellani]
MSKTAKQAAGKIAKLDRDATHRAAQFRDTRTAKVAGVLAELGDQPQMIATAALTIGAGLVTRRGQLIRGGSRMLAAHLVATGIKMVVKRQVDRTRPEKALEDGGHKFAAGHSRDHDMNSFPSGHTAGAVAVARAAAHEIDGVGIPATVAAGAIAAVQPPTGSHYLSDVLAGAAIGWFAEALVGELFDRLEPIIDRRLGDEASDK